MRANSDLKIRNLKTNIVNEIVDRPDSVTVVTRCGMTVRWAQMNTKDDLISSTRWELIAGANIPGKICENCLCPGHNNLWKNETDWSYGW